MNKILKPKSFAEKLRIKLFIYLSSALLIMMLVLVGSTIYLLFNHMKKADEHSLEHIAEIRSIAVTEWCKRAGDLSRQITSRTRIRQELEKYNNGLVSKKNLKEFTDPKLQDALNISPEIIGIARFDKTDNLVAKCGPDILSTDEMVSIVQKKAMYSKPYSIEEKNFVVVKAPIINRKKESIGNDLVIIDLSNLRKIVMESYETDETIKVNIGYRDKNDIHFIFKKNNNFLGIFNEIKQFVDKAVEGRKGIIKIEDLVISYHPVKISSWAIIVSQNSAELYVPLRKKISLIGFFSFGIYIVILFGFWFFMQPLAGKILLHTDELERKIKEKTISLEEEISVREKAEREKEETIVELMDALEKIKQLKGLLPICSNCKKIRDDKGYWSQIESYISKHSEAEFSHSICPECVKKLYPDFDI